jgi:serine/threonine protein kinase
MYNDNDNNGYELIHKIGSGSFSSVYLATHLITRESVAIKRTKVQRNEYVRTGVPYTCLREIDLLTMLKGHPNVMELKEVYIEGNRGGEASNEGDGSSTPHSQKQQPKHDSSSSSPLYVNLVFEVMDMDLRTWLKKVEKKRRRVEIDTESEIEKDTVTRVRSVLRQVLRGLCHCHERGIIHRDLKPCNILVKEREDGDITCKITDFGIGRFTALTTGRSLTHEVVTLWYRAPEVLLGQDDYTTAVDVWSVGCIAAELYKLRPLLPGDSEIHQLMSIFKLVGTPTSETWSGVENLRFWHEFPRFVADERSIASALKQSKSRSESDSISESLVDLIRKMLVLDPSRRITAKQALDHPFLSME